MDKLTFTLTGNQLICSGQQLRTVPMHLKRSGVTYIDLSYNRLDSLKVFERYPLLETLILDGNCISKIEDLPVLPRLTTLSLNKNELTDLDSLLGGLKRKCRSLDFLSLLGNKACPHRLTGPDFDDSDYHRYRCYVIYHLPNLKFLDSTPVTKAEQQEALLRGQFFKVAKPTVWKSDVIMEEEAKDFVPLPASVVKLTHRGIFATCRYHYTGKNSEGNRFIRNKDL